MKLYDIIVVGAGGAGLMTARTLGDKGMEVLLIDRKKDLLNLPFKTLGSFIDLQEFNLSENVVASKITKATIYSKHFNRSGYGHAYILDKVQLHTELLNSINRKKVKVLLGTSINELVYGPNGYITSVLDDKGQIFSAKIFVDATGLAGVLSKKVGLQDKEMKVAVGLEYNVAYKGNSNEAHFFIGKDFEGGYGWIFPLKNKRAIIGFGSFDNLVMQELKKRLDNMLNNQNIKKLVDKDNDDIQGGTIPITDVKCNFVINNLACVGDSVSQVNPVVGEGYRYMFKASRLVADAIESALKNNNISLLNQYNINWINEYYERYKIAKKLQRLLDKFSKSNSLIDLGILFLKTKRNRTVEKLFAGEFSKKELFLP